MNRLLSLFLSVILVVAAASGADPDARTQATQCAARGLALMQSNKYVEAALAYVEALKLYESVKDVDATCEMQANIYWCKKKMNVNDLQQFVAAKHSATTTTTTSSAGTQTDSTAAAVAKIAEVTERDVKADEAPAYFERAKSFAAKNPAATMQIAIRWFEVANRFKDHELGRQAQDLCLKAQERLNTELDAKAKEIATASAKLADQRESYFTRKTNTAAGGAAVPDPAAQRKAMADLKSVYADAYRGQRPDDKRSLALKLFKAQAESKDEPNARWAMLQEAIRLGIETDAPWVVLRATDALAATFAGVDAATEKRKAMQRSGRPSSLNVLKLLENPADPQANTAVGLLFCGGGEWNDGLVMLAAGADENLKRVASMELAGPANAGQQAEVADAWFEIGRTAKSADIREGFLHRAKDWYTKAGAQVTGVAKDRMERNLAEIDRLAPPDVKDWKKISENQWNALHSTVFMVEARKGRCETGILLAAGRKMRIVPHPNDTWQINRPYSGSVTSNWAGKTLSLARGESAPPYRVGELVGWAGPTGTKVHAFEIISGTGQIFLGPYVGSDNSLTEGGAGAIRVKLVPVE